MNSKTHNYNGIDLCKFFFALCVIACHVDPFHMQVQQGTFSIYGFLDTILNTAVPFFFIANGFFLASKLDTTYSSQENLPVICGILKKYLTIYALWTAVYLPVTIYYYVTDDISPIGIAFNFFDGLLFTGEHWQSWHLWYLCSLIWTLLLFLCFIKFKLSNKVVYILCGVLFVFAFTYGHYVSSLNVFPVNLFRTVFGPTGRQFTAPLYLMIGVLLRRKSCPAVTGVLLLVLGLAMSPLFFGYVGFYSEPNLLFLAAGVFIIASSIKLRDRKLFSFLRTSSMVLYYIHLLVYVLISLAFFKALIDGAAMYAAVVIVCVVISVPVYIFRNRPVIKLLLEGRLH